MNNYKKYAAIGGAVAVVACWPLAVGQFAETQITERVNAFDQHQVSVELVNYDRGYLNATAESKVIVNDPILKQTLETKGMPTSFVLKHQIHHGFFSVSTETNAKDAEILPIEVTTNTSLTGATSIDIVNEKVTLNLSDYLTSSVTIMPGSAHAEINTDGRLSFSYQYPSITSHSSLDNSFMEITDITGSGEGEKTKGLWIGEQNLSVGKVSLNDPAVDDRELTFTQLAYKFDTTENKDTSTFSSNHEASIANIELADQSLSNFELGVSFRDIDMDGFLNLFNMLQTDKQLTVSEQQLIAQYADSIYKKGFTIALDKVQADIADGNMKGDWELILPPSTESIPQNPMAVLSVLQGQTNVFLSESIVNQYPLIKANLDQLIQQGFMSHQADGYHVNGKFTNGNVEFKTGGIMPILSLLFMM